MDKKQIMIIVGFLILVGLSYWAFSAYQSEQLTKYVKESNKLASQMDADQVQADYYGSSSQYAQAYAKLDDMDKTYTEWQKVYQKALDNAYGDYKTLLTIHRDVVGADVESYDLYRQQLQYAQANDTVNALATKDLVIQKKAEAADFKKQYKLFKQNHPGMQAYISEHWATSS